MTFNTWAVFVITEIVLSLTPGPAVLFVVSQGLRHGGARSIWANIGILSGNAFYFLLSATGLGALLLASHSLFLLVKWLGAAYLVYLGITTFLNKGAAGGLIPESANLSTVSGPRLWLRGFALQAANPKALIFFTALLPQFINPTEPVVWQVLILGISSVVAEFFVLAGYGILAGRASQLARLPHFVRLTDRVAGVLLVGAGAGLALAKNE
ncbi:MAG: LysE family translocator [Chloroflexi bacterium]|nr:LysE family translocator [Chloroflexota bacterium]